MSALNNNTLANPSNSFYAPAGESARNWYLFPSLTGEVNLVDASGTQLLHSIEANLYYNNELLAKAGDIQNVADWALYPALADVNLDGRNLTDASSATINNTLTATSISCLDQLVAGSATVVGSLLANSLSTNGAVPPVANNVTTGTVTASGLVGAGSVTATGAVQGGSLVTTGGLDMVNTAITRTSSVGISAGGFAPYGALSSPDGVMLTWNGAQIQTGGGGSAANWAKVSACVVLRKAHK